MTWKTIGHAHYGVKVWDGFQKKIDQPMGTENGQTNRWAFLCSFWGKNAKDAISWHVERGLVDKIGVLIYEQEDCGAAIEAEKNGIKTVFLPMDKFGDKKSHQMEILKVLFEEKISYVFLLGFQHLVLDIMLRSFPNRIVNIHPSLFPSFLATKTAIQDALDYGVKVSGITTHIIDDKFDRGTILCQEPIRIGQTDTFETLYPKFSRKGLDMIVDTMKIIEDGGWQKERKIG